MPAPSSSQGGVQSVERALELLELIAQAGGQIRLSDLSSATGLAVPTVHRLLKTLASIGYVRQVPDRRYALGPRLIRLGQTAGRQLGELARPLLYRLVDELGETSNMAVLDSDMVLYVAQAPSRHSMRTFTEVGRRVHTHDTGVGKAILAQLDDQTVHAIMARTGMPQATNRSIGTYEELIKELAQVRQCGYATDDGEQEVGVRCYAVAVPDAPTPTAISVSGPAARVDEEFGDRAVPLLHSTAADISTLLADEDIGLSREE